MQVFNPVPPTIMHIDLNSCFATIEQQANPLLRGKPVVVAAYTTDNGCILASSREAKEVGIKTGMRVGEGKKLFPQLIVLPSDPEKYRVVNRQLTNLLGSYTDALSVESIDEMVMDLNHTPSLHRHIGKYIQYQSYDHYQLNHELGIMNTNHDSSFIIQETLSAMIDIAREIKKRIQQEIGEWLTVSCGIAPNRYLAKVASSLQKPDGLVWITRENIEKICATMSITDFCGIKEGNAARLQTMDITTPLAFLAASQETLVRAFRSIVGYHWWHRLHGFEDGVMYKAFDKAEDQQKTFGQSYAFGKAYRPQDPPLWQTLAQLTMKMGKRLRADGYTAQGVGISLLFTDYTHWHTQKKLPHPLFADQDLYGRLRMILGNAPAKAVRILAIHCYDLKSHQYAQLSLIAQEDKKRNLSLALDAMQDRFGDFVIFPGRMLGMEQKVLDRIAFGGVNHHTGA